MSYLGLTPRALPGGKHSLTIHATDLSFGAIPNVNAPSRSPTTRTTTHIRATKKPSSSSRALAVREPPSQLERYNIWSDRRSKDFEEEDEKWRYERTRNTYKPSHRYISDPEEEGQEDAEDREYKLNLQATFSRPKLSSSSYFSPTSFLRTKKEKRFDEDRETLEHSRSKEYKYKPSFWEVEQEKDEEETWTRSRRRLKRTKTDESTRPLSGWRRDPDCLRELPVDAGVFWIFPRAF